MITKSQVLTKIDELKSYCSENGREGGNYSGFIDVLVVPVDSYYYGASSGLQDSLHNLIPKLYTDLYMRSTTYERPIGGPLPTDYPKGYSDLTVLFDGGGVLTEIMNMDPQTFMEGFPVQDTTDPITGQSGYAVQTNPIIETWASQLNLAQSASAGIDKIIQFCEKCVICHSLISLFEDRGRATRAKTTEDIAKEIYIDMRVKEVIQAFNLDVHIPTYL